MACRGEYEDAARRIALYLAERQGQDGAFPGPDNYGAAFALWLWTHLGSEFDEPARRAGDRLTSQPPGSHGEFNAYALLHSQGGSAPRCLDPALRRIRFGRRHSANWMLLRAVCRAAGGSPISAARGAAEARAALLRYGRLGFIADRQGARSLSYHAFCGALLADLWRVRGHRWAGRSAVRAAHFLLPFVLPNGDALYIGRGQQQIFGYGALLYLLEAAAEMTGREEFGSAAERVFGYLSGFQREDGSFPLVLREEEPREPWAPQALPGWYSYNLYADYLPFLACFLLKAADPAVPALGDTAPPPPHPGFRVHRWPRYTAVLARPGDASTNDLAFPYICVDGVSLFPCYGREGRARPEAMPLPYGVPADSRACSFRDQLSYRLTETGLVGSSRDARHVRSFEYGPDGFICRDRIAFRRRRFFSEFAAANYLFRSLRPQGKGRFVTSCHRAVAQVELVPPGRIFADAGASASGPLVALRDMRHGLSVRPGDTLTLELRVRFL